MNRLCLAASLFAAATAATMTVALLSAIVAIAEPQRGVLIAQTQGSEPQAPSATVLAMVSTATARHAAK